MTNLPFSKDVLRIDAEKEVEKICSRLRELLSKQLKRRGLIVALSGGIDSSVTTALAARAVGADRVVALLMPEAHSSDDTLSLSNLVADHFGVEKYHEDISDILEAIGFQTLRACRAGGDTRIWAGLEIKAGHSECAGKQRV